MIKEWISLFDGIIFKKPYWIHVASICSTIPRYNPSGPPYPLSYECHEWVNPSGVSNTIEYEGLEVKKNNIAIESEEVLHHLSLETIWA